MDEIKEPALALNHGTALVSGPVARAVAHPPSAAPHHVFLIDGSGFIFRAYHALPPLTRPDGTPVGAVLGFSNMLRSCCRRPTPTTSPSCSTLPAARSATASTTNTRRNGPRRRPSSSPQFKLVREATDAFDVCRIELRGFRGRRSDRDLCRAAAEAGAERHHRLLRQGSDAARLRPDAACSIRSRTGRSARPRCARNSASAPTRWSTSRRCAATASTTCRACPGIGVKTAAELINTYGDLENLLAHAPEIKQPKRRQALIDIADQARLSKQLVKLDDDVPLPCRSIGSGGQAARSRQAAVLPATRRSSARLRDADGATARPAAAPAALRRAPPAPVMPRGRRPFTGAVDSLRAGRHASTALDRWIAAAREAGLVAICRSETPSPTPRPSSSASRWRWRRARPPISRSAIARAERRLDLADAAPSFRCDEAMAALEAAARRSGRPQDRPQHQIRHRALLSRRGIARGAARLHDADVLRARRRAVTATALDELRGAAFRARH